MLNFRFPSKSLEYYYLLYAKIQRGEVFVNGLELYLQNNANSGISFNEICLIVLLFADDMVILGLSPEDLQLSLNTLAEYCDKYENPPKYLYNCLIPLEPLRFRMDVKFWDFLSHNHWKPTSKLL